VTDAKALERAIAEITEVAEGFGLDFYPMRYEICPADIIYTFGAYGMPTRFSHWSFGKQFHKMKLQYDLGLSKIYELVINSDPCFAFLLDSNSLIQNKLIVAHVLAHSDFFKNNGRFANTRGDMVESMSATAERIAEYEILHGKERVERFLDAVLAVQEHVDPSLIIVKDDGEKAEAPAVRTTPYDDLWALDRPLGKDSRPQTPARKKVPENPEKDILYFVQEHSRELDAWQRDILTMMREEMLYFWPQLETKIMNEGWATFWHQRIMRELDLTPAETIEFSKLNAGVIQPSATSINPYTLGLRIFEDIERRYDQPDESMRKRGVQPGSGREKMFEVREIESDTSFIRNYLTKELAEQEDLYLFGKRGQEYRITEKDFEKVSERLISSRVNGGFPFIVVEDGDYLRNGELYLAHRYEGTELDLPYLEHVLPHLHVLWGRTVHLETVVEGRKICFSCDGKKVSRRAL
jgi:stage V sporulation protein R